MIKKHKNGVSVKFEHGTSHLVSEHSKTNWVLYSLSVYLLGTINLDKHKLLKVQHLTKVGCGLLTERTDAFESYR